MESGATFINHSSSASDFQQSGQEHSGPSAFGETSTPSGGLGTTSSREQPCPSIPVVDVSPLWLDVGPDERYLLLEDTDTGDILIPLMYMKQVFKVNYSRKISNLHNRLVEKPAGADFGVHDSVKHLYWLWAFEAPQNVKTVVRRELGDMASPTGHIRLALLPVVYNAMSAKETLRNMPLFTALDAAMRKSTYYPLLQRQSRVSAPELHPATAAASAAAATSNTMWSESASPWTEAMAESDSQGSGLFSGPYRLQDTAAKYMSPFKETSCKRAKREEDTRDKEARDRTRSDGVPPEPETRFAEIQQELQDRKRQCREQAARIDHLEREVADMKLMVVKVYQLLEDSKHVADPTTAAKAQMEWKSKLEVEAARRLMYQNSTSMDWNPKPLTSKDHGPRQGHSPWQATLPHQAQSGGPQAAFNLFKGARTQEMAVTPRPYKEPLLPMRRQHSTGCLSPMRAFYASPPGPSEAHPQPVAVKSHLLNLQGPSPPLMPMTPLNANLFGSMGSLELPSFCQSLPGQSENPHFAMMPEFPDVPNNGAGMSGLHLFSSSSN